MTAPLMAKDFYALADLDPYIRVNLASRTTIQEDGCHIWTGAFTGQTPVFKMKGHANKSLRRLFFVGLNRRVVVFPACGNVACINPDHAGISVTARPAIAQPRNKSVNSGSLLDFFVSALSDYQISTAKEMAARGVPQYCIAEHIGVSPSTISRLLRKP